MTLTGKRSVREGMAVNTVMQSKTELDAFTVFSGARAEHRDGRDQAKNRIEAFLKCVNSETFKKWHKAEIARRLGQTIVEKENIKKKVDSMMTPENLKIEYF